MTNSRVRSASSRRAFGLIARRGLAVCLLSAVACGGDGVPREMRSAFDRGDYAEVVALGRHAERKGDPGAATRLYYGMALVAVGRDHEGYAEIDSAVAAEPPSAERAAEFLWSLARDVSTVDATTARRLRKAYELDPSLDLGTRRFAVADVYFDERMCREAAALYGDATRLYPDTAACERALDRLAQCRTELGDEKGAREAMELLIRRYPRGQEAGTATARLDDIVFADAQKAFDAGEYARALELAGGLVERTENRSLGQQARFLMGQTYEALGEPAQAYAVYRDIIRGDRGDSGRIVDRARGRIEALQEAGLE